MKTELRVLQSALAVAVLGTVGFVVYAFESSFGFVVFVFGLMCFAALFSVGGLMWYRKAGRGVKLGVFCMGIILAILGIVMIYLGI